MSIPSYATNIFVAYFDSILLVNPGYEFCSCIKTGIPKIEAIYITGPLAYPPVPTTIFGLCFKIIINECIRLNMILNGNNMFENKLNFLWNPEIQSPIILYPFWGTFFISILFFAPTNKILQFDIFFDSWFAILIAG